MQCDSLLGLTSLRHSLSIRGCVESVGWMAVVGDRPGGAVRREQGSPVERPRGSEREGSERAEVGPSGRWGTDGPCR